MRLLFVGDVMLGRLVNEVLKREPAPYPWGDTLSLFQGADLRVCNLECVIADHGTPWSATPKVFHFRSDAKNVAVLRVAGIDAVSLANNHTLDFGYDALTEMLTILDAAGIHYAGAGHTLADAMRPAMIEIQGRRIAFLACTDNEPPWAATPARPGICFVPIDLQDARTQKLLDAVRQVKKTVDLLIVSVHWGPNWGDTPLPAHRSFGHALVAAGADVVFGHSGHVCRGVEVYQDRLILYCAGDFIDDYAVDPVERNDQSFIFILETDQERIHRLRLYPTVIADFQARMARGVAAQAIATRMQRLCAALHADLAWNEEEGCLEYRHQK